MDDLSIIEDGVVHVVGNRIEAVGPASEIVVPDDANIHDASGQVLMPGFVDIHAHTSSSNQGVYAQQSWVYLANLAFGVTTLHDPSNSPQMIFATGELVRSGRMIGPRLFSTGVILYGAEGSFKAVIDEYDDAVSAIKRTAAWGAFSVKSYNQPRRNQRQMVIKAGWELGVMVVPEGGSTLQSNLNMLVDGHTTIEHTVPVAPLYEPELRLLSGGTGMTPTLNVGFGGVWGENYWYQHTNVWENERLMRFVPASRVVPRARRRMLVPDEDFHHFALAATTAEIVRRGGHIQMGSHGQMQGLGSHWEFWMFGQGGMSNHEALRAATWMGAYAIGIDDDLGSIRAGKLADLILVDGDVLTDLRKSQNISHTMINGRLYEAATMDQTVPEQVSLPLGPELDGMVDDFHTGCLHVH
jgi:hypothetical protein